MVRIRSLDPGAAAMSAAVCLSLLGCYEPRGRESADDSPFPGFATVVDDPSGLDTNGEKGGSSTGGPEASSTGVGTGSESESGGTETGNVACNPPTELDVLFIGNSFTDQENIPGLLEQLGDQAGIDIRTSRVVEGGRELAGQVADPNVATAIASQAWDYIIIQGNSTEPLRNLDAFLANGQTLVSWVEMAGAEPRLYQTWARSANNPEYQTNPLWGGNPTQMQARIRDAYAQLSDLTGAPIVPVGDAWERTWTAAPEINLYASDEYHQSIKGAYLNACVFFAALTNTTPIGKVGEPPAGVPIQEARILQKQAELTVQPTCG